MSIAAIWWSDQISGNFWLAFWYFIHCVTGTYKRFIKISKEKEKVDYWKEGISEKVGFREMLRVIEKMTARVNAQSIWW